MWALVISLLCLRNSGEYTCLSLAMSLYFGFLKVRTDDIHTQTELENALGWIIDCGFQTYCPCIELALNVYTDRKQNQYRGTHEKFLCVILHRKHVVRQAVFVTALRTSCTAILSVGAPLVAIEIEFISY